MKITGMMALMYQICIASLTWNILLGEDELVFPKAENIPEQECLMRDGRTGICRLTELCVFLFETVGESEIQSCNLNQDEIGICCPTKAPPSRNTGPIRPVPEHPASMPDISLNELDSASEEGLSIVQKIDQLEIELKRKGLFIRKGTKEYFHQSFFGGQNNELVKLGRDGLIGVEATLRLVKTFQLDSVQSQGGLGRFSLMNTIIRDTCPKIPPCPSTKYRTADGRCNNLENASWGKSFTAFSRILQPRYFDGINGPRVSYDSGPLPNARKVSYKCCPEMDRPSREFSLLFAQFGEFLTHDLSSTALTTASNGEGIMCCHETIQRNEKLLHPACFPIHIPANDPLFSKNGLNCIEFVRSLASPRPGCNFGPREQLNKVTAFIDGSAIYGSSENSTYALRSFEEGKLKTSNFNNAEFPPLDLEGKEACMIQNNTCHLSGDVRVNEQPFLTLMHTLWIREHNRIAHRLSQLNRGWNDEILFRESRRIVSAEFQHITYTEFLPLLLGRKIISSYKLSPKLSGHSFDYDSNVNPGIINSFAAAAFRMGHSLVQSKYNYVSDDKRRNDKFHLRDHYYNPSILHDNGAFDNLLRSLVLESAQTFDRFVSTDLTNHLFQMPNETYGLDLVTLNIQRGRDHGLAGYNEWREHCGLRRIRNFEELEKVVDAEAARNFSRLYGNVDDIDLFPAGIAENPLPDANLGPTFSCIVAEQFRRLKQGDRFWYENGGMESSFTDSQLEEIRKVTFSRLICDNSKIDSIQVVAFLKPAEWNPVESCKRRKIPRMDLSTWRNEPVWT